MYNKDTPAPESEQKFLEEVFFKVLLKFQRIFSWCGEKQDLKALETSQQTRRGSERKRAFFPRTENLLEVNQLELFC